MRRWILSKSFWYAEFILVNPKNPESRRLKGYYGGIVISGIAKSTLDSTIQFCGWTASVLCGLQDCLHSDNDYFVYIEQDVLIYGEGIVEAAIKKMKKPYMFGDAIGIPHPLQQSFFIIRRDGIAPFLSHYLGIKEPDGNGGLSPERKFHYSSLPRLLTNKYLRWFIRRWRNYDYVPFGFGRKRPLDYSIPHFYFQHSTAEEYHDFAALIMRNYAIDIE